MIFLFIFKGCLRRNILIFLFICAIRSSNGQDAKEDFSGIETRDFKEEDENESNDKLNNVITAGMSPFANVVPRESGFEFTEDEIDKLKLWRLGIVPYIVDNYSFDPVMKARLQRILKAVNSVTGVNFNELAEPPTSQEYRWVLFINRRGALACEDYATKNFSAQGVQRVVVGYDCVQEGGGLLAPTILALLGVPPQHNSPNRDDNIKVKMDNIIPEKRDLFTKVPDNEWLFHDMRYDFLSAGHYDFHKYTLNGSATIFPKFKVKAAVGEGDGFSYNDIVKIKRLYKGMITESKTKESDCSKLFNTRGEYKKPKKVSVKPREKPHQYFNNGGGNQIEKLNFQQTRKPKQFHQVQNLADVDTDY